MERGSCKLHGLFFFTSWLMEVILFMLEIHNLMEKLAKTLAELTEKATKAPELKNEKGTEFLENLGWVIVNAMKCEEIFIKMIVDQTKNA